MHRVELKLRTRAGFASEEGFEPLACFSEGRDSASRHRLRMAEFTGGNEIRFTAEDGTADTVRFNPGTLEAAERLDRCRDSSS